MISPIRVEQDSDGRQAVESWRRPGCGPRCRVVRARFAERTYAEAIPTHDPDHHEQYGVNVLAYDNPTALNGLVRTGNLTINGYTLDVRVDGRDIGLTPTETRIVTLLASRLGIVVSHEEMIRRAWGAEYLPERHSGYSRASGMFHMLRVNMFRIRQKLCTARSLIETRSGIGYVLLDVPAVIGGAS